MSQGYADVLVGLQYGDEGKAKIVDLLADQYDIIARFNGGPNAGHTLATAKGNIALKQIPSGVFYPNHLLYIGSGCVINLEKLVGEIDQTAKLDIDLSGRLAIAGQATLIQPHHILLDMALCKEIGTTNNGIGPCYGDRAMRMNRGRLVNVQLADLISNKEAAFKQILENLNATIEELGLSDVSANEEMRKLDAALERVASFITPDPLFLVRKVEQGSKVLFEGAQSTMLDVSRGSIPYVTSSNTVAGQAFVGGDLPPAYHRRTIGIAKAIMSRVGNGPFVSEFGGKRSEDYCAEGGALKHNKDFETSSYKLDELVVSEDLFDVGIALRILSNEYGTGTKRPRRIGMLDLVQLRYAVKQNDVDVLFLNKCDLLKEYKLTKEAKIPLVTSYKLGEEIIDYPPISMADTESVEPQVDFVPAFENDVSDLRSFEELPAELIAFADRIEKEVGCKLMGLGVGPDRRESVIRQELLKSA